MEKEVDFNKYSLIAPILIALSVFSISAYGIYNQMYWVEWGVYPREISGLKGVFTSPFVHGSWEHLVNNSIPLLVLGMGVFYFFRKVAWQVVFWSVILTGFWVWIAARPAYHIGASGVVYAYASFLFFSGIIRKMPSMYALSGLIVFLYGSMVWGIFPIKHDISWEAHLFGLIAGILLSVVYRKEGPQRKVYDWEKEEEAEEDDETIDFTIEAAEIEEKSEKPVSFIYHYKENDKDDNKKAL